MGEVSPSLQPPAAFSATPSSGGDPRNAPVNTSIEAPYELPEGWKWIKIKDCFDVTSSKRVLKEDWKDKGIPFYRTRELVKLSENGFVDNELFIDKSYYDELKEKYGVPKIGDLLISGVGTIGVPFVITTEDEFYFKDGNVIWFKNKGQIIPNYIFYLYRSDFIFNQIHNMSAGTTVDTYTIVNAMNTVIPLPPTLTEQQRIVNRIATMFAKLDQAQEKAQSVLDSFETRKAAILHKAFTGQLKIDNEELTIEDWEETTIGECCKLGSGGTPSKSHPEYYENGDIPWLKTGEIDWNDIYDVEEKITNEGVENSSAKIFPAESVVVAMYGMGVTRGKAAIIKIPTATNQAVCVLQPNEKLNNRFLFYYFMCNYWQIREQSVGGNQLNLSGKIIASFPIKLPPLNYQLSIVNFLDTVLEKESRAKEAAGAVLDQIALLKKSILARAFRGEL